MSDIYYKFDPDLDLQIERTVDVKPEAVWAAWTKPEHLIHWFTPAPWKTIDCEIDLRPGGLFRTTMESPEGQQHETLGCYLDVVENRRLIFSDALGPGFRPGKEPFMTAIVTMEPDGDGTRYTATALHKSPEERRKHEDMGFADGWGKALDQLVAHMKGL